MDDLLSDFLSETSDHIDGIATYLVLFEQNPSDSDAVTQIFRLVHTIKGTSGFLGLSGLQDVAHAAETLIDTLRDGRRRPVSPFRSFWNPLIASSICFHVSPN